MIAAPRAGELCRRRDILGRHDNLAARLKVPARELRYDYAREWRLLALILAAAARLRAGPHTEMSMICRPAGARDYFRLMITSARCRALCVIATDAQGARVRSSPPFAP